MEPWLIFGALSYISHAISSSIDKYFMNNGHNPIATNTFKMFFNGVILLVLGITFFDLNLTFDVFLWAILLGGMYAIQGAVYFTSLEKKDIEIVIPYLHSSIILFVFIGSILLFQEEANILNFMGIAVILGGIYAIISKDGFHIPKVDKTIKNIFAVIVLNTIYALLIKAILQNIAPINIVILMYFSAATWLTLFILLSKKRKQYFTKKSYKILISALFGGIGTFMLYTALVDGDASKVFPMAGLQSVFTFIIASIFLKEKFQWHRLVGTIGVVSGLFLINV